MATRKTGKWALKVAAIAAAVVIGYDVVKNKGLSKVKKSS